VCCECVKRVGRGRKKCFQYSTGGNAASQDNWQPYPFSVGAEGEEGGKNTLKSKRDWQIEPIPFLCGLVLS
jgi:hypothetical protein